MSDLKEEVIKARRISTRLKPSRKWQPLKLTGQRTLESSELWENLWYEVGVSRFESGWPFGGGPWVKLGIYCADGEPRHDWRDFQRIKNQLCGPEWEALELFPAESRLIDPSNFYILWCAPKIPIGMYEGRRFLDSRTCLAPQRDWAKGDEPPEFKQDGYLPTALR